MQAMSAAETTVDEMARTRDEVTDVHEVPAPADEARNEGSNGAGAPVEAGPMEPGGSSEPAKPSEPGDARGSDEPAADQTGPHPVTKPEVLAVYLDFDGPTTFLCGFEGTVSGVFVATHDVLALGTAVTTVICLPDGSRFEARGAVRFLQDERDDEEADASFGNATDDGHWPGYGVVFDAVPDDARDGLEAFTAIRPPRFYPD